MGSSPPTIKVAPNSDPLRGGFFQPPPPSGVFGWTKQPVAEEAGAAPCPGNVRRFSRSLGPGCVLAGLTSLQPERPPPRARHVAPVSAYSNDVRPTAALDE